MAIYNERIAYNAAVQLVSMQSVSWAGVYQSESAIITPSL